MPVNATHCPLLSLALPSGQGTMHGPILQMGKLMLRGASPRLNLVIYPSFVMGSETELHFCLLVIFVIMAVMV